MNDCRDGGRSENRVGGSSHVVGIICALAEIGISDLVPKSGGMEERAHPYLPSSGIPK